MTVDLFSLAERPDLADTLWGLSDLWPAFMLHDPIADLYFSRLDRYAPHVLIGVDGGEVVARQSGGAATHPPLRPRDHHRVAGTAAPASPSA